MVTMMRRRILRWVFPSSRKMRQCFFAASIAIPVFLVIYAEYLSLYEHNHNDNNQDLPQQQSSYSLFNYYNNTDASSTMGGGILEALSSFRLSSSSQEELSFAQNSSSTKMLTSEMLRQGHYRRSRRDNLMSDLFRITTSQHTTTTNGDNTDITIDPNLYRLQPLHTLLNENRQIIGNVQNLLHYAIVGFGKCGTTSMMALLKTHSQLQSLESEVWAFVEQNPARLVERLHKKLTKPLPRGYKCPGDILASYAMNYYRKYFPQTKLIVGVRHPILWFESLYNFRIQNFNDYTSMPTPNQLIGPCHKGTKQLICTKRGHFAYYLMQLGKQYAGSGPRRKFTALEKKIANYYPDHKLYRNRIQPMTNPIYLFDVHQLGDTNTTRVQQMRYDLAGFLGVSPHQFRIDQHHKLMHVAPGREWDAKTQAHKDQFKINICDDEHVEVRHELLQQARDSSMWIRQSFLNAPGVHVSSRDYLEELLQSWMYDPCYVTTTEEEPLDAATEEIDPNNGDVGVPKSHDDVKASFENPKYALPPLDTILNATGHIVGDPQVLLQFAIIGFGKAGTTTLMMWLNQHPELQSLQEEIWALPMQQPARLLTRLHRKLTRNLKRGYKCPGDVLNTYSQDFYRRYWPKTKLFIGVRHPVLHFQSLYNFRIQNFENHNDIPHPNDAIGLCVKSRKLICTYRGNFAHHLMKFGKHIVSNENATGTKMYRPFTTIERELANWYPKYSFVPQDIQPIPNDIFLFELNQLADTNETRKTQLRHDIQHFLDLTQELPDSIHYTPGKKWDAETQAEKDRLKIDICNDEYLPVRTELMMQARYSSQWIREVFLDSPGVYVSSRPYLEHLIEQWMIDPCNNQTFVDELPSEQRKRLRRERKQFQHEASQASEPLDGSSTGANYTDSRPPLPSIIGSDGSIIGDPQFLLDFAVIGFGKTGTSSVLDWLSSHPEAQCLHRETWSLMHGEPQSLIRQLYQELPSRDYKRCYKCPGDITEPHILNYYRTLWPKTKLIVGVRHPVLHFEGLYNFRAKQIPEGETLRHPNRLIGLCHKESKLVCTRKENFAHALMRLGKQYHNGTRPFTDLERRIAQHYDHHTFEPDEVPYMPNDVFLFELSELSEPDELFQREFAEDFTDFLEFEEELPLLPPFTKTTTTESKAINICDDEFIPVRKELMELARMSSQWIREVFLDLPGVYYASSREHIDGVFLTWMHDPCGPKSDNVSDLEVQRLLNESPG